MADFPEIRNPERNEWLGIPADLLKKVQEVARAAAPHSPSTMLVDLLIGDAPKALDKLSYGERISTGKGETFRPNAESLDLAGLVPQGKMAAAAKGIAAALGGKGLAAIGAIRAGGNPDLWLHSGIPLEGLQKSKDEIRSPSLMITKEGIENKFGDDGAILIAREGAFDPRYSTSTLFNRDAYVMRGNAFRAARGSERQASPEEAYRRLEDRFGPLPQGATDLRFTESSPISNQAIGHAAVLDSSPSFKSFRAYENDPRGAATLAERGSRKFSEKLEVELRNWADKSLPVLDAQMAKDDWLIMKMALQEAAKGGDVAARQILFTAARAPSSYAELKVLGQVPITPEYWAGAIVRPNDQSRAFATQDLLAARGIPSERLPVGGQSPQDLAEAARYFQGSAGPYAGRRTKSDYRPRQWQDPRELLREAERRVADIPSFQAVKGPDPDGTVPVTWGVDLAPKKTFDQMFDPEAAVAAIDNLDDLAAATGIAKDSLYKSLEKAGKMEVKGHLWHESSKVSEPGYWSEQKVAKYAGKIQEKHDKGAISNETFEKVMKMLSDKMHPTWDAKESFDFLKHYLLSGADAALQLVK